MDSKVVRAEFGSGLIRPRSQTCCASPTQTPARLANSPGFKSFHCPRWRITFSLERFSDPSRICLRLQPLFALSTALNGQPVSKHDTSCPFQRLDAAVLRGAARSTEVHACVPSCHRMAPTLANQILARTFFRSVANLFACPAVGKFSRASSAGGRRHLQ